MTNVLKCPRCGMSLIAEEVSQHHCGKVREVRDVEYDDLYIPAELDNEVEKLLEKYLEASYKPIKSERLILVYGTDGILYRFKPARKHPNGDTQKRHPHKGTV